jgi:hypothetical protein
MISFAFIIDVAPPIDRAAAGAKMCDAMLVAVFYGMLAHANKTLRRASNNVR